MTQAPVSVRTAAIARAAVVAAIVLALDQLTKHTLATGIAAGQEKKFLPGVTLVHYRNTGVAFSMFSSGGTLVLVFTLAALTPAAITRGDIANYVQALFLVYILLIFVYILLNMMFSLGLRPPYSRWTDAIMNFLRDVCEPYLRIFRRFIPPIGMFDLTPMIAIIVLYIVQYFVVKLIGG